MSNIGKGINLDSVRERLEKLKKSKKSSLIWKPTEKEQTIRIVPYKYKPDNFPFIELYFHYNLNGKIYLSPISFGEPDPIMEVAQKLKSAGDKESWKMGKELEPKLRTFAPIIIRGREAEGIKFWGFGKTIYEEILSNIADPECGDITDPVTGRDIVVYTVKEEGKQFFTPKIRIKMTQTPVTTDREIIQKIVNEQPDIRELYELKTYEELENILDRYLHPEKYEDGEETSDETKTSETPAKNKTKNPSNSEKEEIKRKETDEDFSTESIEDAFSELFENN